LDLILDLTGDPAVMAVLAAAKHPSTGVLDRQASLLFFDIAAMDQQAGRRESEISLATSFATAMLEASPDTVMVIDRDYRIVQCNTSPLITRGRPRREVAGRRCYEVLHGALSPCSGPERVCPMEETLRTGKPSRSLHEIPDGQGQKRICHVTTYPLFNRQREIVQVVDVVRDITRDLTEQLELRAEAIKKDLARYVQDDRLISLGRLVASVCHEINNPLSSIVTFNKLVLSFLGEQEPGEGEADGHARYLELAVQEALRCGSIVKNLLSFARQDGLRHQSINLVEMVRTITELTRHQMEMASVECDSTGLQGPLEASGDKPQIQQCLMNLVLNALDAMPEGGRLTISGGREASGAVWITISDTGPGIDGQSLPHIFEPFYSTKLDGKGVGLGLSMVYGIISQHGGVVEASSEPGKGAAFTITLPPGVEDGSPRPGAAK
jgi:PAS domain S-box-containing protein